MQCSNPPRSGKCKKFNVFTWHLILLNECHEHFMDFIICKINNSAMFLISQAFLSLATRRRCGAGRPGGSGGRAARDPTYGEPPGRCQRSSDFNAFCSAVWKLLLKTYENQCIFLMFFHAPRGPTYGRPPGRCKRTSDLRVFCVLASLLCACWTENVWRLSYFSSLRTSCKVWHAFP